MHPRLRPALTSGLAALLLAALAPTGAWAQGSIAEAEAAYAEVDFEAALRLAQEAIEAGGLSPEQLARAYELVGISAVALDDRDLSRSAFINLLALDPEASLERSLSPTQREPFMEARGFWATQTERLSVEIDLIRDRGALRVSLSDPIGVVESVLVNARVVGSSEYVERREAASDTTYFAVDGATETPHVEYTLALLDEHGNRLLSLGDEEVPEVVGEPVEARGDEDEDEGETRGERSRAWIWVIVGVVAAGVVAGGVATGVVLGRQAQTVSIATDVTWGLE